MVRRMILMTTVVAVGIFATALASQPPQPKPQPDPESIDLANIVQMMGGMPQQAQQQNDSPFPDFKQVTKDMTSKSGMFTLWYYPPGAKDKDQEKLLCQIPSAFLGQQFMLSTSFAGGGFFTGFPLDERVVKWELRDRQLVLIEPQTMYVVNNDEVSDAVRRTYPDRIRVAVPILTKTPNGDPLIDLGPLLKSNFADIAWTSFAGMFGGGGGGGINSSLSKWTKKKTFELNVEIGVEMAISRSSPPGSYDKKYVHYSFWKLPQTDYRPRIADDRIGYFLTVNQDWSKPVEVRDLFNRYIDRWHLVKRDPSLEMCEPRQPIIFYIEKTVPVKFRRAVREGILEWNKAFEQIGFLNAIVVRQQTEDNEWKDLDPEDMRYSFFRWVVNGAGFAMGPHRANPFTGQIYDADIIFDDGMVRFFENEADTYLPEAIVSRKFDNPAMQEFLNKHPSFRRPVQDWHNMVLGRSDERVLLSRMQERMAERGRPMCTYAHELKHELAVARTILADQPQKVKDKFLYEVIKEVATHEVGHTLGLRHNFKASSIYTLEEIQQRRKTGAATCGSVMDYNPTLLFAKHATDGDFVLTTIGPYDYWAIEYGYRPFDGNYKSAHADEADKSAEQAEEDDATKTADAEPQPAPNTTPPELQIDISQIPPEILAQMPPEVKKMLESGNLEQLMQMAQSAGMNTAAMSSDTSSSGAAQKAAQPISGEAAMLKDIASRAAEPELAYATDEDTIPPISPDPRSARFDMGADPIDWAETRIALVDKRMADVLKWAVAEGESWYHLRRTFLTLLAEKAFVFDYVGRYIGGAYFVRHHRGDPNAETPFTLVEPEVQRRALRFTADHLYSDQFYDVSPELLNHLAPSRWSHAGSRASIAMDFPVHQYVSTLQWWNLFDRLFPFTLQRIHDNEWKTDAPNRLTAAEYIRTLQDACWQDAVDTDRLAAGKWSDTQPFLSSVRRSLQREYLGLVEPMVREKPGVAVSPDLHAMLRHALHQLADQLGQVQQHAQKLDFATAAHVSSCKSRIDRMLSAELGENQPMLLMGGMFFRQSGQQVEPPQPPRGDDQPPWPWERAAR